MRMYHYLLGLALTVFSFQAGFAEVVVFDNGAGGASAPFFASSDLSATVGGELADDVTFSEITFVNGVNWAGIYSPDIGGGDSTVDPSDDNFEIRIYDDAPGQPGSLIDSFAVGNNVNRIDSGIDDPTSGTDVFVYSADINFSFDANVTYWISIVNNTVDELDNFDQAVFNVGGNAFGDPNPNDGVWIDQAGILTDFQLTFTAVPEPGTAGIVAFCVIGMAFRRRR